MSIHLNLELTDHCNLKCKMCSQSMRTEAHNTPMSFMSWESWKSAIDGLRSYSEDVALSPHWLGEPTLHPDFDRFVSYAFEQNQQHQLFNEFKLHTNAVLLPESRIRLLLKLANPPAPQKSVFRFIHLSIDAYAHDTYLKLKGADRAALVYENVHRFLMLRHKLRLPFPYLCFGFVVQPENVHEGGAFLSHWRNTLSLYGHDPLICGDWPDQERDAIYFRPLNTADQQTSNRLHANLLAQLKIPYLPRRAGSF